jgi:hypothetical protein
MIQELPRMPTAGPLPRNNSDTGTDLSSALCRLQGLYYLATGIWPLINMRSFEQLTGPKTDNWTGHEGDHWLVKTVGVLVTAIGASLLTVGRQREKSAAVPVLAVGSALGLAAIDCVYVARGVIAPIYLADAVTELGLAAAWMWDSLRQEATTERAK